MVNVPSTSTTLGEPTGANENGSPAGVGPMLVSFTSRAAGELFHVSDISPHGPPLNGTLTCSRPGSGPKTPEALPNGAVIDPVPLAVRIPAEAGNAQAITAIRKIPRILVQRRHTN